MLLPFLRQSTRHHKRFFGELAFGETVKVEFLTTPLIWTKYCSGNFADWLTCFLLIYIRLHKNLIEMELNEQFIAATIASKQLASKPSNEILLQLYSLYKQATEGDVQGDAPTNPFDFVGKAKYEAWAALAGKTKEVAMQQYVSLVESLKG
jgi:diazepam-binding inhibitor (GABA receptor modulating acyl-CoA-binding protein)